MGVTEELIRRQNEKEKRKSKGDLGEEETLTYALQMGQVPLNRQRGVFGQEKLSMVIPKQDERKTGC